MKTIRLNKNERQWMREMGDDVLSLRYDRRRRLRNALLALAMEDPQWMIWVEREIDPSRCRNAQAREAWEKRTLMLVEARARALVLRHYNYLGRRHIGWLLFRADWPFSDSGALTPG